MIEKEYIVNKILERGGKIQKNPYHVVLNSYQ